MSLILYHKNDHDQVALWKIEHADFPEPELSIQHPALKNLYFQRRLQKQACLKLASLYAGNDCNIIYDDHGKPHLANDSRQLSFSHSGDYAAMMLSNYDAGIDFELTRPKVLNIIHKFLNERELESLQHDNKVDHAHIYWGAKEALYKVYGKQGLIFKEHILIDPFNYKESKGYLTGRLQTGDFKKEFKLFFEKMFGYMLVYVVN